MKHLNRGVFMRSLYRWGFAEPQELQTHIGTSLSFYLTDIRVPYEAPMDWG